MTSGQASLPANTTRSKLEKCALYISTCVFCFWDNRRMNVAFSFAIRLRVLGVIGGWI
jgi:hypothetical protein